MLLGVDRVGGAHILHSLFSVPVGPYDPDRRLFGCRGELSLNGFPAINKILVASFEALYVVSTVSQEDHGLHIEGFRPSGWQTSPCEKAISKEEGKSLSCWVITLPSFFWMPAFHSFIWKAASASFPSNSSIC